MTTEPEKDDEVPEESGTRSEQPRMTPEEEIELINRIIHGQKP